jgi:hypothetical protein
VALGECQHHGMLVVPEQLPHWWGWGSSGVAVVWMCGLDSRGSWGMRQASGVQKLQALWHSHLSVTSHVIVALSPVSHFTCDCSSSGRQVDGWCGWGRGRKLSRLSLCCKLARWLCLSSCCEQRATEGYADWQGVTKL